MVHSRARVALRVVWASLIPIMLGCVRLAPRLVAPHEPSIRPAAERPATALTIDASDTAPDPESGDVDFYGNDVSAAVAEYKLDADGSLYETHSPQTQLPRLRSPKS